MTILSTITTTAIVTFNGSKYSFTDPHEAIRLSNLLTENTNRISMLNNQLTALQTQLSETQDALSLLCTPDKIVT